MRGRPVASTRSFRKVFPNNPPFTSFVSQTDTLASPYGSEPSKRRPVLIIQNDVINPSAIRTTICAAITSNVQLAQIPYNILLEKSVSGLGKTNVITLRIVFAVSVGAVANLIQGHTSKQIRFAPFGIVERLAFQHINELLRFK